MANAKNSTSKEKKTTSAKKSAKAFTPFDNSNIKPEEIEKLEHKYLMKYWYFLKFCEDDIISGLKSMEEIRNDWQGKYGKEGGISEFDVGCERIVYALLNGKIAGRPNSCPVSSDLFFEVDDAFIHIDLKSVTTSEGDKDKTDNINDFTNDIFIGRNQNSYESNMRVSVYKNKLKEKELEKYVNAQNKDAKKITIDRPYEPNLPTFYKKTNGEKKITLTYFVCILNSTTSNEPQMISILCMPNGKLANHYKNRPLKAGKTIDKVYDKEKKISSEKYTARFNFSEVSEFELLPEKPKRVRIVYKNPNMSDYVKNKLNNYLKEFDPIIG